MKVLLQEVSFSRGERRILQQISLEVPQGKVVGIMGPSGVGKTTLLNLITGQLTPDKGNVLIDDIPISRMSWSDLFLLRQRMGMLFQSGALFTDLTVFENVAFPLREHTKLSPGMIRDLVLMKLQAVGLRGTVKLMPAQLSGGMARRVALARAVVLDPELMLYDEPFAGQDPISTGILMKLIRTLNDSLHMTSIIVSHNILETCQIADLIYVIADGQIVQVGTPDELQNSSQPLVQQFMQGLPDGPIRFHYPAIDYGLDLTNTKIEDIEQCWDSCKI